MIADIQIILVKKINCFDESRANATIFNIILCIHTFNILNNCKFK